MIQGTNRSSRPHRLTAEPTNVPDTLRSTNNVSDSKDVGSGWNIEGILGYRHTAIVPYMVGLERWTGFGHVNHSLKAYESAINDA